MRNLSTESGDMLKRRVRHITVTPLSQTDERDSQVVRFGRARYRA